MPVTIRSFAKEVNNYFIIGSNINVDNKTYMYAEKLFNALKVLVSSYYSLMRHFIS